ncbi:hypothetical protein [Xanthomonas arboricola]
MEFLHKAMKLPGINRSSIARALKIDASQVSRIAAGRFAKLDGNALKVCKYAQLLVHGKKMHSGVASASDLGRKLAQLSSINPGAARAISDLIDALAGSEIYP